MINEELSVLKRYTDAASRYEPSLCCPTTYNPELLKVIPDEILQKDYGCGDPSQYVKKGETVIDLGSGAGKLCYIMAQVVGLEGKVIGIDMNDEMLKLARKFQRQIGDKLGYHNVEFKKARIQNLKLDIEKVDKYLEENPIRSSLDLSLFNAFVEYLEKKEPLIPNESVDVVVSNCVLNLVNDREKNQLFKEIHRVLKKGGRAVISDIVSDEDIPQYMKDDPELWSGCISGAFREDLFLKAFEDAGFYGIEILKWDEKPWRIIDGIEFRSVTVCAYKGKEGPCVDYGHAVIYQGPFRKIEDDDGHIFERGKRIAVCDKTFNILRNAPYREYFIFIEPYEKRQPRPFPCSEKIIYRSPKDTKGANFYLTTAEVPCCPSGECNTFEPFVERIKKIDKSLKKEFINTIQVNIGNMCNQSCIHCHVEASPEGKRIMPLEVMENIITILKKYKGLNLDITGGAPELHPDIEDFIERTSDYAKTIFFRSNLTALSQKKKLINTLKNHRVEVICSLPDISAQKTDYQRGKGVFEESIRILKLLNDNGYGYELRLDIVHNPGGFVLPELNDIIEERYRNYLKDEYGIVFNKLYILNNMPIGRFKKLLIRHKSHEQYMNLLYSNFNPATIDGLMCRYIVNVGWDGKIYDCDFNNALGLSIDIPLKDLDISSLVERDIKIGDHCYGCTALRGAGCYGAIIK